MRRLLLGLAAIAAPAAGQEWWENDDVFAYYGAVATGSNFFVLDEDVRIDKRYKTITIWLRGDHENDSTRAYRRSMGRMILTCDGYYSTTAYTTYLADGSVVDSWDAGLARREAIRPETIASDIERALCKGEPFN